MRKLIVGLVFSACTVCLALGAAVTGGGATTQPASAYPLIEQLMALPTRAEDPRGQVEPQRQELLGQIAALGESGAAHLIERLVAMPDARDPADRFGSWRLQLEHNISALSDVAIRPLQEATARTLSTSLRRELTEVLASIGTPAGTKALLPLLADKDDDVRGEAIRGLIARVNEPADQGGGDQLLPTLAKLVTEEKAEGTRVAVCWAMPVALKPFPPAAKPDDRRIALAAGTLRERLKNDLSPQVRFAAACALTKFDDNSGADELKRAAISYQEELKKPGATGPQGQVSRLPSGQLEHLPFGMRGLENLVQAIEQVSGRKFGPVPMNPMLSSSTRTVPVLITKRAELVDELAAWAKGEGTTRPAAPVGK